MAARPAKLDRLLSTGKVRWARSVVRGAAEGRTPGEWGYREIAGRVVELIGAGDSANLTIAAGLLRDAQVQREPVAWIAPPGSTFHPPDLADWGVDLAALALVRAPDAARALRAADELLRSAAFGLVVLDGIEPIDVPLAIQVRLANLAQQHDAALLWLCSAASRAYAGSLASLRATTFRRRSELPGRFEFGFEVTKDKRRGRGWSWSSVCDGPPGLR